MGVKLFLEDRREGGKVIIGVSKDGCDPIVVTREGDIFQALAAAPKILKEALEKWALNPRNPAFKATLPKKDKPASDKTKSVKPSAPEKPVEELPPISDEQNTGDPESSDPVRTCRVCGCTDAKACEGGCSWVEADLCSKCKEKETDPKITPPGDIDPDSHGPVSSMGKEEPGFYLQDSSGPFESVQLALDALGIPQKDRPHHNRWDRLSRAWKERIIRK